MDQKSRDVILAILSIGGIFYIIGRIYLEVIKLLNLSLGTLNIVVLSGSLVTLILGILIWKNIKLSEDYSKYFIILFIIVWILDLIYKLLIIY